MSDAAGAGRIGDVKMGLTETGRVMWFGPNDQQSLQETLKVAKDVERPVKRIKLDEKSTVESATPLKKDVADIKKAGASPPNSPSQFLSPIDPNSSFADSPSKTPEGDEEEAPILEEKSYPQIFAKTTIYINGSTAPAVSDHRLKQVLTRHGANMSISLGRRTVTHVILGQPSSKGGSGGGLSGSKIQKEIANKRGESVKYVTAEWVLESVKAGKRLPERRFEAVRLAPKGVGSVASMFGARLKAGSAEVAKEGEG